MTTTKTPSDLLLDMPPTANVIALLERTGRCLRQTADNFDRAGEDPRLAEIAVREAGELEAFAAWVRRAEAAVCTL